MSKGKVIVGMSGGVDSSVAAALLKEEGYEVIGVTMKIWDGGTISKEGAHHACYGPGEEEDIKDAQKVAQILEIPFYIFDLKQEFKTFVLDYFSHEYLSGRTPNPCIRCNQQVKFGAMVKKIYDNGIKFDYFATGHYIRVEYDKAGHQYLLKKAKDLKKDQSYFLYSLSQEQLGHILFPIGDYTKEEVKIKAKIRYRHKEAEVAIIPLDKGKISVKFREPQIAITPGQAIVFYDGDIVVGGGVIEKRI